MNRILHYAFLLIALSCNYVIVAQSPNNCVNAVNVCNNQLAEKLDDGPGVQECPNGGCGCMLAGEKNTRWFRVVIQTAGVLEFTISPYNGNADYDFAVWNRGAGGACPTNLSNPDRCNYASPKAPTGIKGSGNGNTNSASGNLFSNSMNVNAGDVIYILVDNWDGTNVGFRLDFFGGSPGSGTGTTATFSCSSVNTCSSCSNPDCNTYRFNTPADYSFAETAANGACHSNFAVNTKNATVCGTFTVPNPYTTVQFPLDRGIEITASSGNTATCLATAVAHISYQVWGVCGTPLSPIPGTGIYTGLNNSTTYKVCKTVDVSSGTSDCYLSRICLPYWTMVQNDDICGALPITVNAAAINGTNAGATSGFNAGCTGYNDVWYKFTAPASGRIQVNVLPNASSDVKLSLIGPQAGLINGVSNCNKPCDQMTNLVGGCNDYAGTGGAERLFSFVVPGQTYYIWISGTASKPNATFSIEVTETITSNAMPKPGPELTNNGGAPDPIPSNDDCSNAIDLNPLCNPRAGTNIGATAICTDPDPQYVAAISLENDVWYKWTAPANNGNAQVTLEVTSVSCSDGAGAGSSGLQFGIFRGSCASLIPVQSGTTTVTFTPIAGQTYYFVVDGNAGSQCTFSINIKRPTITSQVCTSGNYCSGSSINATFNYSYSGSNPGYRWAYCKSSTWGTPCTIDLDNPSTYFVYNPAVGLPNPGCTPATYTFVGYLLADNGATSIAAGYPLPQPASANCVRATNPCTFNIYPDIKNLVTVTATPCSQVVTTNASCTGAPITITGNTNQTASPGTNGTFTPVTVTWNAPYLATAPATCGSYTIQKTYACPGSTGANTCTSAPMLTLGVPISSNNNVPASSSEYIKECTANNNNGSGVWFTFIAPNSGNVNINLTNVGAGDNLDAVLYLFDSRLASNTNCTPLDVPTYSDICATCTDLNTSCKLEDQLIYCSDANGTNGNESIQARYLNPGEIYYVMVDGYYGGSYSNGNFTITVVDAGNGPIRPANDDICNAQDLTNIGCSPQQGSNINATSKCDGDPPFPSGYSTENSVWYSYTATNTGPTTIKYLFATGTKCAGQAIYPGVQFALYTSSNNNCTGTLTNIPAGTVYNGQTSGQVTVNMIAGQKYYILVDGYAGNECKFEFQIYNGNSCCTANLGSTEGTDKVLCYGDDITLGVTADPINFGTNAGNVPMIGWQLSNTAPSVINPFNPANSGKIYLLGKIDTSASGVYTMGLYHDAEGNYPTSRGVFDLSSGIYDIPMSGFSGTKFNALTDTITVCVNAAAEYFNDMYLDLIAPDGTSMRLMNRQCGSNSGYLDVCFSNFGTTGNISTQCPIPTTLGELTGYLQPASAWSALNGKTIDGTWKIKITDASLLDNSYFYAASIEIKKPYQKHTPNIGTTHGDIHIVNNDPYKYTTQTFWLTPVTFVNYDATTNTLYSDSCYSYGSPIKITLLEKVTTPTVVPVCNTPGDGSNGIALTVTSPDGGWPSLTPKAVPAQYFNFTGTGAATGITFPSSPSAGKVDTLRTSNAFTVLDGQAWGVSFIDNNGCKSSINGTFDKPSVGILSVDNIVCKGDNVQFNVSQPPPLYSKYKITIDFDSYPQDISWILYDVAGNVVESGGGYAQTLGAVSYTTGFIDPNKGPYRLVISDGFADGLGSGGGSTSGGGSSTTNFIKVEELDASGGATQMYNQSYAFCTPIYCVGPAASLFSTLNINLGTPTGTFSNGISMNMYSGVACGGVPIAGALTQNTNGSGTINTNALNIGNSYSVKYAYSDKYACAISLCKPFKVFPRVTINPTVNCSVNPPVISVNANCSDCNATYIAEYSYNLGASWTTATSGNFQEIYTYARVKNSSTGEVACDVSVAKLADCPTVLPIELIYLKAIPMENTYIKLNWATASERNTQKYEILRSTDGSNFVKIAEIPAAGNSNTLKNYSYDDHNVLPGIVYYYQIREIDNDLHIHLTNIANTKLEKDKLELISIYPNPMIDNTVITLFAKDITTVDLTVYNDIGALMKDEQRTLKEGINSWEISTEKWSKGVYYFILKLEDRLITKQVVKLQ
ncbi:MAG: T9SS type A sorting domain-containing protein [Chitinophagales bacterium]